MNSTRISSGFDCGFFVDQIVSSGGLGLFWNNDTSFSLLGYSFGHIDVSVISFWFSGFYDNPKFELRRFS